VTQCFSKSLRLLNSDDYQQVFDSASFRISHQHLLLLACHNDRSIPRLGLVVAKKHLRLSVDRNRIKRLSRESFRINQEQLKGFDLVILSRPGLGKLTNKEIVEIIDHQWRRLLKKSKAATLNTNDQKLEDKNGKCK